jgi:hypothetical protein
MDQTVLRETISITNVNITDEDKALGHEFNRTMWRALARANLYLTHGPESARLAVTKTFIQAAARLSAVDAQSEIEEHRIAFMRTMSKMTEAIDVEPKALAGRADDQDD